MGSTWGGSWGCSEERTAPCTASCCRARGGEGGSGAFLQTLTDEEEMAETLRGWIIYKQPVTSQELELA